MPTRSTTELYLNQDTAAVIDESRRLRELLKLGREELRAELEVTERLHNQYPRAVLDRFK
jgi:hypothetical protein